MTSGAPQSPTAAVVGVGSGQLHELGGLLRGEGVEVVAFRSAEDALAGMDASCPPGLIVTALLMPGLDGWRFCQLLRSPEFHAFHAVPVIAVSEAPVCDQREWTAAELGFDAFVPSTMGGAGFIALARSLLGGEETSHGPRVLIADPDVQLARALGVVFAGQGRQVDMVSTAPEAMERLARASYEVAVLERELADGAGSSLFDEIGVRQPDCVRAVVAADTTPEAVADWMARGASVCARKPVAPEIFVDSCMQACRARALLCQVDRLRRLESVLEGTGAGAWEWNVQTGEVLVNERWAKTTGYTLAELQPVSSHTRETFLHPDDLKVSSAALARHFAGDVPQYDCACRMRHRDGHWVWVRERGRVVSWSADGRPLWFSGAHVDTTESRAAEEELRKGLLITENIPTGLHLYHLEDRSDDRTLRMAYANPASGELTGIGPEKVVGRTLDESFPDLRSQGIPQRYAQVVRSQTPIAFEDILYGDDRLPLASFSVKAFPLPGDHVGVAFENISERKASESALQHRDALLDAAVRASGLLLAAETSAEILDEVVRVLGEGSGQDRVCFFAWQAASRTGKAAISLRHEWLAEGIAPLQGDPRLQALVMDDVAPTPCERLRRGQDFCALVRDLPTDEARILVAHGAVSVLWVPVMVDGVPEGFLAFDNCRLEYGWVSGERAILAVVAANLGAAFARTRAEEALRDGEERYRALFDRSLDCVLLMDFHGDFLDMNQVVQGLLGYRREDIPALNLSSVLREEHLPMARAHLRTILETGLPAPLVEYPVRCKDGRTVHLEVQSSLILRDGIPYAIQVIGRDITERKRAEETLRASEDKYRRLVENTYDILYSLSPEGILQFVSPAWTRNLGHPVDEVEGRPFTEFIHPDDLPCCLASLQRAVETGDRQENVEYRVRHANGTWRWHISSASPARDAAGVVTHYDGIGKDITDRKRAEEELTHATALLKAAVEQIPAGMLVADAPDVRIRLANPAALDIGGIAPESVGGSPGEYHSSQWPALWPDGTPVAPEDLPLSRAVRDGEVVRNEEVIIRRSDGERRHVLANAAPVRNPEGEVVAGVFVFPDVTDLRRAEEERRRTMARRQRELETVVAVASSASLAEGAVSELAAELTELASRALDVERVGVWLFEKQETRLVNVDTFLGSAGEHSSGEILHAADLGSEFETLRAAKYVDAHDVLDDPRMAGYVDSCLKPNNVMSRLDAGIRSGGRNLGALCFEHVGREHHWEDDEIAFACQLADQLALAVTHHERRRVEEEREKLQGQLAQAQKMESVGRLAGGVAHDFNNMLGVILGHVEMALEQVGTQEPIHEDLREIQMAAERSANLTRQLLAFARKQTISPKALDLNETVEGMIKMLRRLIGEDIDLAWLPGTGLGVVFMDPSQVDQILANLCVNARDAIEGVGRITIETANAILDEEYCACHPGAVAGSYVVLVVSDDGCGMDAGTLAHIFEPFFTTKGQGEGTGLGLATVYGVVKQSNGYISAYSELGRGTTFRVYLPRHVAGAVPSLAEGDGQPATGGNEAILLVEDESAILKVARKMLETEGYLVVAATTPVEALRLAEEHAASLRLLVTDVVMPEMNGRELLGKVRSLCPGLECLFMSGYTANVIAHHGILDEGVNFIQKPFRRTDLLKAVRKALDA